MGCDIHLFVECREPSGPWRVTEHRFEERNYALYSVLADVRNYEESPYAFVPIALPRGLPADLSKELSAVVDADDMRHDWLGDHSFSWLTLAELQAYDWKKHVRRYGSVDAAQFAVFERNGRPDEWCHSVGGGNILRSCAPSAAIAARLSCSASRFRLYRPAAGLVFNRVENLMTKKFQTRGVTFLHDAHYSGDVAIVSEGRVDDGIETTEGRLRVKLTIPFLALKDFMAAAVRKQLIEQITQSGDDEILGVDELGDDETPLTDESDRDEG